MNKSPSGTPAGTPGSSRKRTKNHNVSYESPLKITKIPNISINNENYGLDENFKIYLLSHMPIFNDHILYSLVIKYCLILNKIYTGDIVDVLDEINIRLNSIKNKINNKNNKNKMNIKKIITKTHPKTGEDFELYLLNTQFIKPHIISPDALIETFINCILYYNSFMHNIESITNSSLKYSTNNKLYQTMNIALGMDLGNFIISLYSKDLLVSDKNTILLTVLKEIALKLNELQNVCGFIHGDLNIGNVFVYYDYENEDALPKITFIDYGFSSVRLSLKNGIYLIVTSPTEINIGRNSPFDIIKEPHLRAADMYHLIDDLSLIEYNENIFDNHNNWRTFNTFINGIINLYGETLINKRIIKTKSYQNIRRNRRQYTPSEYFKNDEEKYKILIPEFFLEIDTNENGKIINKRSRKNIKKPSGMSMFGENMNNEPFRQSLFKN